MNRSELLYGLTICLFGIGIVFLILIGLSILTRFTKGLSNPKRASKLENEVQTNNKNINTIVNDDSMTSNYTDELVAIITAAVACCMGSSSSLVVKSIRRIEDTTPAWGKISRHEQMLNRF